MSVVSQTGFERTCDTPFSVCTADGDGFEFLVWVSERVKETQSTVEAFLDTETSEVFEVLDSLA